MKCTSYKKCVEQYNQAILSLWKLKFDNAIKSTENTNVRFKQFCFHVNQIESPIWFFGMNPSLPKPTNDFISQTSYINDNLIDELKNEPDQEVNKRILVILIILVVLFLFFIDFDLSIFFS